MGIIRVCFSEEDLSCGRETLFLLVEAIVAPYRREETARRFGNCERVGTAG